MLIDPSHYGQRRGRGPSAAEPARRRAAAGAHRRADAARRARRRTTGSGATWPSTSGSPSGSAAPRSPTSPAARATARTCSPSAPPRWSGSTPTRRPTSTRRLRYRRPNLRFERTLVERFDEPRDAIVFLQTIEHVDDPGALLARFSELAPAAYVSTPNRLTLAPEGAEKSDNPWHLREYTAAEYRELVAPHFASVELYGLFHAGKLRVHELALRAGWDRVHPALRLTKPLLRPLRARDLRLGLRASTARASCDLDRALDFIAVCRS